MDQVDFSVFGSLLKNRPEISPGGLKRDLERYYLPFTRKLISLKGKKSPKDGLIAGVSAIQGAGKTTQGEVMEVLLRSLGHSTYALSIDDHYITHSQLCALREKDPRYIRRGVTHDIQLAARDLKKLQTMEGGKPILISGYDKGIQSGDGDRLRWINPAPKLEIKVRVVQENLTVNRQIQNVKALQLVSASYGGREVTLMDNMGSDLPILEVFLPTVLCKFLEPQLEDVTVALFDEDTVHFQGKGEVMVDKKHLPNGWRLVVNKPDFIFYDGWMLGARSVEDESVFTSGLPALETEDAQQFAKDINKKLKDYEKLWSMFEFLNLLYVPNYQISVQWRNQAEEHLRQKGEGMTAEEITEFVHYFWRSVHPAIHIKNLARDTKHTDQVVVVNDDHSVGGVLSPAEVNVRYP